MAGRSRRLAAVVLTDMVGYSSMTQRDEALALGLLNEHREIVRRVLRDHRGREVKTIGDAVLLEFESALDAVECSLEVQRTLHERNQRGGRERMEIRIGIHVGDVVHEGDDVFGDAINLVARIQPLAEPGGICVSAPVWEQVRNQGSWTWSRLEATSLKNIEAPPVLYKLELPWLGIRIRSVTPFVGREAELEKLHQGLEAAARRGGRAVFVTGESGIGKSRLAQEGGSRAEKLGFRVLHSHSLPGELGAPYAPWVELAREFLRDAPAQLVYRVCGNSAGEIAKLVPELSERVGPTPAGLAVGADESRIRFYDAITQLFQRISTEFPLLLVLDDLHWADTASLRLLQYFVMRLSGHRILVLGTSRIGEEGENPALEEVCGDLNRERLSETLVLSRLDAPAVEKIVTSLTGPGVLSSRFEKLIYERTDGNPFFVEELIRSLAEEGILTAAKQAGPLEAPTDLRLPDSVRRALQHRIARLSPEALAVLQTASIIGCDFSGEVLQQVTDLPENAFLAGLDQSLRARFIREARASGHRVGYTFSDRRIRDLLYEEQSVLRRRKFHLKVVATLEAAQGRPSLTDSHELAFHALEGGDLPRALQYTLTAAKRADEVYAREEAIRQRRLALEVLEVLPDEPLKASLLERLGSDEGFTGEMRASLRDLHGAATLYERLGDRDGAARARVGVGRVYAYAFYDEPNSVDQFQRAIRLLDGTPESSTLGWARFFLQSPRVSGPEFSEGRRELREVLELAQRLGDLELESGARFQLLWSTPLDEAASVPGQLEMLENRLAGPEATPQMVRNYSASRGWSLFLMEGDARGGIRELEAGIRRLRDRGAESLAMDVQGQDLATALLALGEVETASKLAEETYAFAQLNYPTPDLPNLVVLAEIARLRGDFDRARSLLDRGWALMEQTSFLYLNLAPSTSIGRVYSDLGNQAEARRAILAGLAPILGARAPCPVLPVTDYAELLVMGIDVLGPDGAEAPHLLEELQRVAALVDCGPMRAHLAWAEGLVAIYDRRYSEAVERLESSVNIWTQLGWTLYATWVMEPLVAALAKAGDEAKSRRLLEAAVANFRSMGAVGSADRLARRGPRHGNVAVPGRAADGSSPLPPAPSF